MNNINDLFKEMLDVVMSLDTMDQYSKAFFSISFKRNIIAKEYEKKKNELDALKGEVFKETKVSDLKIMPTLLTTKPEAKKLLDEIADLEEVRKLLQNALDTILLRKDFAIAERRSGI